MPLSGNYAVQLIANGCESTFDCYEFQLLGNVVDFDSVSMYPNPTSGKLKLSVDLDVKYRGL